VTLMLTEELTLIVTVVVLYSFHLGVHYTCRVLE
jgi:hypothetical protein